MAVITREVYKVTNPGRTYVTYRKFLEHFLPDLLSFHKGHLPQSSHRFFLLREETHLNCSVITVAILQDIQTQEVFLVNAVAIEKEGEYEYGA